jgi:hypothetical protein
MYRTYLHIVCTPLPIHFILSFIYKAYQITLDQRMIDTSLLLICRVAAMLAITIFQYTYFASIFMKLSYK